MSAFSGSVDGTSIMGRSLASKVARMPDEDLPIRLEWTPLAQDATFAIDRCPRRSRPMLELDLEPVAQFLRSRAVPNPDPA